MTLFCYCLLVTGRREEIKMPRRSKRVASSSSTSQKKPRTTRSQSGSTKSKTSKVVKVPKKSTTKSAKKTVKKPTVRNTTTASTREAMLDEMRSLGYDGQYFAEDLANACEDRVKRGKPARAIRYLHYCIWAHALMRKEIGPADAEYAFPECVLTHIRHVIPGNIKGEIREDAYPVSLQEFCAAMDIPQAQSSA